jgi:hypothetical protein
MNAPALICLRRVLATCLPALAVLLCPVAVQAGTYDVPACDAAGGANNSWVPFNNISSVAAYAECPSGGDPNRGLVARTALTDAGNSQGVMARLLFAAPPATTIVALRASYDFFRSDAHWEAALSTGSQVLRGCPAGGVNLCSASSVDEWIGVPNAGAIYIDVFCAASSCPQGRDPSVGAKARLYSAVVRIQDDQPPTIGSPGGGMWSDGWKSGMQTISFDASDNTGIARNLVLIDGQQAVKADHTCDFTFPRPCPDGGGTFNVQTSGFSDGAHQLDLQTVDSAGNPTTVSRTVLIDNTPPVSPQQLTVDGGEGWRSTNSFDVRWSNPPADGGAPIAGAVWQLCPSTGSAPCTTGSQDGADLAALHDLKVPASGDWLLRVWLRDQAGNADQRTAAPPVHLRHDADAPQVSFTAMDPADPTRIVVTATDATSGIASGAIEIKRARSTAWTPIATELRDGNIIATLPDEQLKDGRHDLRARAQDQAGNQRESTTFAGGDPAIVTLPVRAKTHLTAGHQRGRKLRTRVAVRYRGRVSLSGRLLDTHRKPMGNVTLSVLARTSLKGSPWRPIATVKTTRTGRFHYRTKPSVSRTVRVRYEGTATVRASTRNVRVRVAAGSSVRVDRHQLRNGQTLHFSGRVHGPHLPKAKVVQIQARVNGRWQSFASTHADAMGRWKRGYRFIGTHSSSSYTFRILVPSEAGFPFASGHTRPVRVRVHGP